MAASDVTEMTPSLDQHKAQRNVDEVLLDIAWHDNYALQDSREHYLCVT